MRDLLKDSKRTTRSHRSQSQNPKNKQDNILDFTQIQEDWLLLCDECGDQVLAEYPQYKLQNPHAAGPCYICPKCHRVYDKSLGDVLFADFIKPVDTSPARIMFADERPDSSLGRRFEKARDLDPEPQEEERLRAQGATIIDKRVVL
jgi:hypothetical protein